MTTVVLSPPSRPSSPPTAASNSSKATSNTILVTVAVETSVQKAGKEAPTSRIAESDSPTTTAIALEPAEALDVDGGDENVERRANSSSFESEESCGTAAGVQKETAMPPEPRPIKKRRRVSFEAADIVEFEPTIYTTTVTSGGIPLGMSLNERSRSRRRLDSYEMERQTIRVGRQNYMEEGYLDPQEREIILNNAGCEEPVMATVEAEVNTIIQHRRESNEIDFDFMYGLGEIEEGDDDDVTPVLSFETTGLDRGEDEEEEEEDGEDENSLEGDAADDQLPLVSMSDDDSAGEEEPSASETVVNPSDCGETETAPV